MTDNHKDRRLYDELAWLWPLCGGPADYSKFCDHVVRLISTHSQIPAHSLLNIGCGGGNNAFNFKKHYEVTGIDLSPPMLAHARELNPECEFVEGDMRSFSLGKTFDAVLMDDGLSYMRSQKDLAAAFQRAYQHLKPGGVLVATPDDTTETFLQNRVVVTPGAGARKPENIEIAFIENCFDPDPTDEHYELTMIFLIRENNQLRVETDHHLIGLFPLEVWRETLERVGFKTHEEKYTQGEKTYITFSRRQTGPGILRLQPPTL